MGVKGDAEDTCTKVFYLDVFIGFYINAGAMCSVSILAIYIHKSILSNIVSDDVA